MLGVYFCGIQRTEFLNMLYNNCVADINSEITLEV